MKKLAAIIIFLMIQSSFVHAQSTAVMPLDSAIAKCFKIISTVGASSVADTSTARVIINTFLNQAMAEKYKDMAIDYLNKSLLIINFYSPEFDALKKKISEEEQEINNKFK